MRAAWFWRGLLLLAPVAALAQVGPESVTAFVARHPQAGTYTLSAYVVDIYLCPPCPEHALCKPCIPDNATLSDAASLPDAVAHHVPTLRVALEVSQAAMLKIGRRYEMRVEAGALPKVLAVEPSR